MSKLYLVGLRLFGDTKPETIDGVLSYFGDWLRYNSETWFVYTHLPSTVMLDRLRTSLGTRESALVIRVEPRDFAGWVPSNVRHWLQSKARDPSLAEILSDTGMQVRSSPFAKTDD